MDSSNNYVNDDEGQSINLPQNFVPRALRASNNSNNNNNSHSPSAQPISPWSKSTANYKAWICIFNFAAFAPTGTRLSQYEVEQICISALRVVWDAEIQLGYGICSSEEEANALLGSSNSVNLVLYNHVSHPNSYYTICTTALPQGWCLADVLETLNYIYGSPQCNFMSGREYTNKHTTNNYKYAFLFVDNREVCELLIRKRKVQLAQTTFIIIKRAPDRHDTSNVLKIQGQPEWYTEQDVQDAVEYYTNVPKTSIDYVFIPEDHESGRRADYCFVKFSFPIAFERAKEYVGETFFFHDHEVHLSDPNEKKKDKARQKSQPVVPYGHGQGNAFTNNNNVNNNNYVYGSPNVLSPSGPSTPQAPLSPFVPNTGSVAPRSTTTTTLSSFPPQRMQQTSTTTAIATTPAAPTHDVQSVLTQILISLGEVKQIKEELQALRSEIYGGQEQQEDAGMIDAPGTPLITPPNSPRAPSSPEERLESKKQRL
jgi:hypothetical protein